MLLVLEIDEARFGFMLKQIGSMQLSGHMVYKLASAWHTHNPMSSLHEFARCKCPVDTLSQAQWNIEEPLSHQPKAHGLGCQTRIETVFDKLSIAERDASLTRLTHLTHRAKLT